MEKFFRIIELPKTQVLLTKDFDEENDSPILDISFFVDGMKISQKMGYKDPLVRDRAFDTATEDLVQRTVDAAKEMLSED